MYLGGFYMFSENLATLRKQRGMSQEVLAQQLNVVRQTVSKWEKGLSVPDAEMLQRIAELFEVRVDDLLGSKINDQKDIDQIAAQLAVLNEQLANKARRSRQVTRNIVIGIISGFILLGVLLVGTNYLFTKKLSESHVINLICTVDGQSQSYTIVTNGKNEITAVEGNNDILSAIRYQQFDNPNDLINGIVSYSQYCAKDSLDYYCDDNNVSYYRDYRIEHHEDSSHQEHSSDSSSNHSHHDNH